MAAHDRASEAHGAASGVVSASTGEGPPGAHDPLSDVLDTIRLRGALFFVWEPHWHYATGVPHGDRFGGLILPGAEQVVSYHIVLEGPCWAAVAGGVPLRLDSGDVLLVPHGDAYCMASAASSAIADDDPADIEFFRLMAAGAIPPVVVDGGAGPERNRIICGFLGCERQPWNPLLDSLPRLLRLPALQGASDPLAHLVEFALAESRRGQAGERCLLLRLSEVMFVEVLRRHLRGAAGGETGWLAGLRDPLVGRALALLHGQPARAWTLAVLARELATSRSTLAARFTGIVGQPPMHFLARWRMQLAARRLADGDDKIFAIAREVGYESEAAFSRAFKRWNGVSPMQWRERTRAPAAVQPPGVSRDVRPA